MKRLRYEPRLLGLLCATFASSLGILYLALAGAPLRYLVFHVAALVLGAAIWLGLGRLHISRWRGGAVLALTAPVMATALFGVAVESASRWVTVGPLSLQISLITLPAAIVLYARSTDPIGTAGILIAALALAAQPDRAMAGVLVAGVSAIVLTERRPLSVLGLVGAVVAFLVTLLRPDGLPAVPFVDGILYSAFDVHLLVGMGVVAGCLILLVPGAGALGSAPERPAMLAFGAS
ncbi:MAG TPA: hypothetical protein VGB48_02505 [Allosphingosinicella sp.]|jgi:cell division protein FtsW (lipid II flippase)